MQCDHSLCFRPAVWVERLVHRLLIALSAACRPPPGGPGFGQGAELHVVLLGHGDGGGARTPRAAIHCVLPHLGHPVLPKLASQRVPRLLRALLGGRRSSSLVTCWVTAHAGGLLALSRQALAAATREPERAACAQNAAASGRGGRIASCATQRCLKKKLILIHR